MKISIDELNRSNQYVTRSTGYRIVYFYEKYHDAPQGLYALNIEDFMKYFKENGITPSYVSNLDILNRFLSKNKHALGVAIYNVDGTMVLRKNKENINKINNSKVFVEELIYDYGEVFHEDGYRIVYINNDDYVIGSYCKEIKDYMIDFVEFEPYDEEDVPHFISVDDLLNRYLDLYKKYDCIALYKVDGICIAKKCRNGKF